MQQWVEEKFGPIKNKGVSRPKFSGNVFTSVQLGRLVSSIPVRDVRTLELSWALPPIDAAWRTKPFE
jgi:secreted Zn-dependent insulinase-like peptidase